MATRRADELERLSRNAKACLEHLLESCKVVQNERGLPTSLMHRDYVRSMLEQVRDALDGTRPWVAP